MIMLVSLLLATSASAQSLVYIGTFTRGASKGIYSARFDTTTGKLTPASLAAETANPSWVTVHPNQRFLYAANELPAGTVSAFSIDSATGQLKLLNQVSSRGPGPCHVALDKTAKWLFAANYSGGSTAAFPVQDDGTLGEAAAFAQHVGSSVNPQRQSGPHAHMVAFSPDNRYALVADLGLDQILGWSLGDLKSQPQTFAKVAPGSGPRHLAFTPDGKLVYVLNEIRSTITAFRYNRGQFQELQTLSTLPADFTGNNSTAEIAVHPKGKFVYASNRGHNSIAIFRIQGKGMLTPAGHVSTQGKTPRSFGIDPSGSYLLAANQDSGNVVVFRIDQKSGGLAPTGSVLEVPFPVSIAFVK